MRVARAATHDVIAKDFIVSAKARGHSNLSIIWNAILPNVRDAILVEGAMRWSWMLLGFSSLSFLGFGVSPPTPDWGLMISNARGLMSFAWWAVIAPVVGLSSLIIGINLTADAFAKALGTGFRGLVTLKSIEVINNSLGKPSIKMNSELQGLVDNLDIKSCHLSISDEKNIAVAFVVLDSE